jgi:hypothetical protein
MSALRELIAAFGIDVDDKKLEAADKKLDGFIGKLEHVGTMLVGGTVAIGLFEFAKGLAETADVLDKSSIRLGVSTDAIQELGYAAKQSGSGVEDLTTALLQLQDKAGDALQNKTGENAKAFKKLGIDVRDASGEVKSADQLLLESADIIAGLKTDAERTTVAMNLFGKQGRQLLPFLKGGSKGIAEMREEFQALGGGFSKEAIKASLGFGDALTRVGIVIQSMKGRIAIVLLPILQRAVEFVTKVGAGFLRFAKDGALVESTLAAIGAVLAGFAVKAAIAFAPFILGAAKIALIVGLIEDLIVLFTGGKSAIGFFIDELFGVGASVKFVEAMKAAWDGVVAAIKAALPIITAFIEKTGHALKVTADFLGLTGPTDAEREAERKKAVRAGGTVRFKNETEEEAAIQNERARREVAEERALEFATPQVLLGGATEERGREFATPRALRGGATVQQTNAPVFNVTAQDPAGVVREIENWWDREVRQSKDALLPVAEGGS